jgi:hypothetical protein
MQEPQLKAHEGPSKRTGRWKKGGQRYTPEEAERNRKSHEQPGWRNGAKVHRR